MHLFYASIGGISLASGLLALPAAAQDVIRPGDSEMTCEALAGEINALSRSQVRAARREEQRANGEEGLGGFARSLGAARPLLDTVVSNTGGDAMTAAVIARSAIDGAQDSSVGESRPQARRPAPPAAAAPTVDALRLERLNTLHDRRGC